MKDKQIKINLEFSLFKIIKNTLFACLLMFFIISYFNKKQGFQEQEQLNKTLKATLEKSINEKGQLEAKITSFESRQHEDFLKINSKDEEIISLQKEVKRQKKYLKKQGSVTNFKSNVNIDTSSISTNIGTKINPIYKSDFNLDGWVIGSSISDSSKTRLSLKIKNEYSVVIGKEPQGLFGLGKAKPFGKVINKNPFSDIKELKTYQVSLPKKKNFSVSPSLNFGINAQGETDLSLGVSLQLEKLSIKF